MRQLELNWSGSFSNFSKSKFGKTWLEKTFKFTSLGGRKERSFEESCSKSKKLKTDKVVKELLNHSPKRREAGARIILGGDVAKTIQKNIPLKLNSEDSFDVFSQLGCSKQGECF